MSKAEAEALVQRIARTYGRTHYGVSMWVEPGQYKVVVTDRARNTQSDTTNPEWSPLVATTR